MSSEVEPVEVEAPPKPRVAEPDPVAGERDQIPPRHASGALFDTGMGAGMGSPAAPTLLRQLSRRPPEERKSGIDDLNGRVGNRRVARMIAADRRTLARVGGDDFADMPDYSPQIDLAKASDAEKLAEIEKELDADGLFNPSGITAWHIWLSFGSRLPEVANANPALWERQVAEAGGLVGSSPMFTQLRARFKADVETVVLGTLASNRQFVMDEMTKLGLKPDGSGGVDNPTKENDASVAETQKALDLAGKAMKAKELLRGVPVTRVTKYERDEFARFPVGTETIYFDPKRNIGDGSEPGTKPWAEVKEKWDVVQMFVAELMSRYPVVQSLIAEHEGDRDGAEGAKNAGKAAEGLSKMSPQEARKLMGDHLRKTLKKIDEAVPLVGDDLDYRDFAPVHARLIKSGVAASGTDWSLPFERSILKTTVRQHGIDNMIKSLGLGTLAAAAFILAEFATAGMATFLLVGAGVGLGAAQAAMSWEQWGDLATMHEAQTRPELGLISREQVDSAAFAAVLDTVFVFADVAGAVGPMAKAARASRGLIEATEEGMKAGSAATIKEAIKGPAAPHAIQNAVNELGVHGAAHAAGKSPQQLADLVRQADPALADRIMAAAELTKPGMKKGVEEIAQQLPNLAQLKAAGQIAPDAADALVRQAIDQFGMTGTIKRAGGWKTLTKTLGDGSPVAKEMDAWRKSLLDDLQTWVTKESDKQAAAVRTGTEGKPTNDLDINMMEIEAAGFKDRAKQYLAGRAGIGSDELGKVLDAAFMVDPTRMHLQDVMKHGISDKVRAELARGQAKFDEQLVYGRRIFDAKQAGDTKGAEKVLSEARARGIDPMEFKPLGDSARKALELEVDQMMKQLDQATDEMVKKDLINRIHQSQAMINASTPDAYMMAGGVALNVSKRDVDKAKMPGMVDDVPTAGDRYGAALDETVFLDEARRVVAQAKPDMKGLAAKLADEVKNIGKHGERMAKQMGADAVGAAHAKLERLAKRFGQIMAEAKSGSVAARTKSATELKSLQSQMRYHLSQLDKIAESRLRTLRSAADLGEAIPKQAMEDLAAAIALKASVAAAARQVDGYTMAVVEFLESVVRVHEHDPDALVGPMAPPVQ